MAGFDFAVPIPIVDRSYAVALLRKVKYRASKNDVSLTFSWNTQRKRFSYNHYYICIYGDLISVEIFTRLMLNFCDGFSEGYIASNPLFKKSLTPVAFLGALHMALEEFHHKIEEISDHLRSNVGPFNLNSITFSAPKASGLRKSMTALTECFLGYFTHRSTSEQLAEQIHSSSEHLMRRLLSDSVDLTYAQLVSKTQRISIISADHSTSLLQVKDLRRDSKHRAQNISEEKIGAHFQQVIGAIHSMIATLRKMHAQQDAAANP